MEFDSMRLATAALFEGPYPRGLPKCAQGTRVVITFATGGKREKSEK